MPGRLTSIAGSYLKPVLSPTNILTKLSEGSVLRELKKVNPRDRYLILFPDSRNVFPTMGTNLMNCKAAEDIYLEASDLVKMNILKLCCQPEKGELTKSLLNEYIAAYVTSHATWLKFSEERPDDKQFCKGSGGIGVGFINSLVFGDAMTFSDGLDLIVNYAKSMERSSQIIPSARLIVRLKPATNTKLVSQAAVEHCLKEKIPQECAVCSIVGKITPSLVVFGGHEEAIRFLEDEGYRLFDFKEMRRDLRTPHAYNSVIMAPARKYIEGYINNRLELSSDYTKDIHHKSVYSPVTGKRVRLKKDVIKSLIMFPSSPVLLEPMLQTIYRRPQDTPYPNTLVAWDQYLIKTLIKINRKASVHTRLLEA